MASDLTLYIFDSTTGAMVCARWLGMSGTLERAHAVLMRAPACSTVGFECWADLTPAETEAIAEARYADGASPDEVRALAARFAAPTYWWMLERTY